MANEQLPTPSPSPPPATEPALPARINIATRDQHAKLNRLIIGRLPLALPPIQKNPACYGHGLEAFAQVYFVLESAWLEICDEASRLRKHASQHRSSHEIEVLEWLSTLLPSRLPRTQRLKNDLRHVCIRTATTSSVHSEVNLMMHRVSNDLKAKPHTFVAYAWVMYMAIFSGGRWIRNELSKAGPEFWLQQPAFAQNDNNDDLPVGYSGFTFLSFDGKEDGEDTKALFKLRLAEAETSLTMEEKQDVVEAAKGLFEDLVGLVQLLDRPRHRGRRWNHRILTAVIAGFLVLSSILLPFLLNSSRCASHLQHLTGL